MKLIVERSQLATLAVLMSPSLEAANAAQFREQLAPFLDEPGDLLLDLDAVNFIDSTGLGAMISVLRVVRARGGRIRLCGLRPPVRMLLDLVRATRMFEIHGSREEALAAASPVTHP